MPFLILKNKKAEKKQGKIRVIISKKVSKKSTVRNKLKRQIRAIIRQRSEKKENNDINTTIIVSPEITKKSFQEIKNEINRFIPDKIV